jgi:hypothetical protein
VNIDAGASLSHQKEADMESELTPQRIERAKTDLNHLGSDVNIFYFILLLIN